MADGILNPIEQFEADFDFDVYTKQEVDALLDEKADADSVYTKTETDTLLSAKADADTVYTKAETDNLLDGKADKRTTLAGYGITDAYTKTETDSLLNNKANADSVYTKTEADNLLSDKADKSTTLAGYGITNAYTKAEVNSSLLLKAPIDSPTLTGTPQAPTPSITDDSTKIATTEFVKNITDYSEVDSSVAYTKTTPNSIEKYAKLDALGGKTIVWNQLINFTTASVFNNGLTYTNNDGVVTVTGTLSTTGSNITTASNISVGAGHQILIKGCPSGGSVTTYRINGSIAGDTTVYYNDIGDGIIKTAPAGSPKVLAIITISGQLGDEINLTFSPQIFDLTLMFGSGNEPSTVQEFQQMFPAQYYPYNAGQLMSAGVTSVVSDINLMRGVTIEQGVIGTNNGIPSSSSTRVRTASFIKVKPSTTYEFSVDTTNNPNVRVFCVYQYSTNDYSGYKGSVDQLSAKTATLTTDATTQYIKVTWNKSNSGDIIPTEVVNPTITYETHPIATYPIPAEIQALTGYGWSAGQVYNYVDFKRKVFVQRVASVDLGTLTWTYSSTAHIFSSEIISTIKNAENGNVIPNLLCAKYISDTNNNVYNNVTDKTITVHDNQDRIWVYDSAYTNATTFTNAMNGVMLYYELATPQETDISEYLTDANMSVEANGTLTFINSHGNDYAIPVPSEITYLGESGKYASIVSPNFAGVPTVPTPASNDNSKTIANTEWVTDKTYTKTEIDAELTPTKDGTWVKATQTTGTNLEKLEGGIEYLYGLLSKQYAQLKSYVNGNYYDYDADTDKKYTKTIPANVMPYASIDSIGGKTLVWNQLVQNGDFASTSGWMANKSTISTTDNILTATATDISTSSYVGRTLNMQVGHKFYAHCNVKPSKNSTFRFLYDGVASPLSPTNAPANVWTHVADIFTLNSAYSYMLFYYDINASLSVGDTVQFSDFVLVDLTLMFGAGNEPTSAQEFQQMFPADYYPYNAGQLLSAGVTEVKSVGFNVWDEQWEISNNRLTNQNNIPVHPNTAYYFYSGSSDFSNGIRFLDYDKNIISTVYTGGLRTTPANCWYVKFFMSSSYGTTYNNDICINLSSAENGTYKPYMSDTYSIPASVQALTGYGWSAGSVYNYVDFERKVFVQNVGAVDLGTLTWTYYAYSGYSGGYSSSLVGTIKPCATAYDVANILSLSLPLSDNNFNYNNTGNNIAVNTAGNIKITIPGATDSATLQSILDGIYLLYELAEPIETDISAYLTDDYIAVEGGGTLSFPNSNGDDYRIDVPSSETYMIDLTR